MACCTAARQRLLESQGEIEPHQGVQFRGHPRFPVDERNFLPGCSCITLTGPNAGTSICRRQQTSPDPLLRVSPWAPVPTMVYQPYVPAKHINLISLTSVQEGTHVVRQNAKLAV